MMVGQNHSPNTARILLADSSEQTRLEWRTLLSCRADWQICGEAPTGPQTVDLAIQQGPDVVVLDLALPKLNGLEATRRIKNVLASTEVLVCMMHETDDLLRDVLHAGAGGCILKSDVQSNLLTAVDALCHHRPYLTPNATRAILTAFLEHETGDDTRPFSVLTPREREILQLLAEGKQNAAIANVLSISIKTVETHRAAIMKKLGLGSLAELARYAIRNRVITPSP